MKKEISISERPERFNDQYLIACLQSWSSFVGSGPDNYICIMGKVNKKGHMYQSLKETKACVLNFPSNDIYERCVETIENNQFETDEITVFGLTAEKAAKVNAPRIKECFLNIECEYLWEHDLVDGGGEAAVALKAVNICMDSEHYDQNKLGRYGKNGFLTLLEYISVRFLEYLYHFYLDVSRSYRVLW